MMFYRGRELVRWLFSVGRFNLVWMREPFSVVRSYPRIDRTDSSLLVWISSTLCVWIERR